jgi:transcriptional regulator with XRE-family HTH domain
MPEPPIEDAIRDARRALGLTQVELARALGVAPNTVARWERGEVRPGSEPMVRMALRQLRAGGLPDP